MNKYRLYNDAKDDLIRIPRYGLKKFGTAKADKYFDTLFDDYSYVVFHILIMK